MRFYHRLSIWVLGIGLNSSLPAQVPVLNEIHHTPAAKQERVEFIELYWPGETAFTLDGWRLSGGVDFVFPPGTLLNPREYLVIAQDPAALAAKYGTAAVGPWTGRLSGDGERIRLRDPAGNVRDSVDFGLGFPWPTVGEDPGYSIELINPQLDNDLGGHWRASVLGTPNPVGTPLFPARSSWFLFRGSAAPPPGWNSLAFDERDWESAPAPVGYDADVSMGTPLDDMRGAYTQFFIRRKFQASQAHNITALRLEALFDDGFKLWLNGSLLLSVAMNAGNVPFDAVATGGAREDNGYEGFDLSLPSGLLREGDNVLAVQVANISLGSSSDCFFDARLMAIEGPAGRGPSPGRINVVFATNAPPAIRQVNHLPRQPHSGEAIIISARITDPDGLAGVTVEYQVVNPGNYIRREDPPYTTDWTSLAMSPQPSDPDIYAAILPLSLGQHRRLIRYRLTARDQRGAHVTVPYPDDPQPNFALFCYNGVPNWIGTLKPGAEPPLGNRFSVGAQEMNRLPVYHLLAQQQDVENATWFDRSHGDEYFWTGTLVYDGAVYDHIHFRPRGGVWRYAMGKNMWKFDFTRGHDFQARDNWGRPFQTPWTKLNLGACIQQANFEHRGEQGLFESVGFRLFQLVGLPAPHTSFVQLRIIDEAAETRPDDQFRGDFWGLYLATEQLDGRFLDEHGLPDGNLYKMESGTGEPNNIGTAGPLDSSDLFNFLAAYTGGQTLDEEWWRSHLNLEAYYNYQAIVQSIHHYDIADGKNYFYFHNPEDDRWTVLPWDLDLTWADNMYRGGRVGGNEPFKGLVLSDFSTTSTYPEIAREFRNRVREIRDLLWNEDEAFRLIDEYARLIRGTNSSRLIDADRAQWDYNPIMIDGNITQSEKAGQGRFYQFSLHPNVPRSFEGAVQIMKNYVIYRASNIGFSLDTISAEPNRPVRPQLAYSGPPGFPADRLRFTRNAYEGAAPFQSVRWRIAEIGRTNHPAFRFEEPMRYEIEATWDSGELSEPVSELTVPGGLLRVGGLYRARVRHTDIEGRTSNWSPPVEFTAGQSDQALLLQQSLKLTEIMYNPPPEGFEFLELHNSNPTLSLDLAGAAFGDGIDYVFPTNAVIAPRAYVVLIGTTNERGFRQYHGLPDHVPVFGPFDGSLDNGGETLQFQATPGGLEVFRVLYDDQAPWPAQADGAGYSLVIRENGSPDLSHVRHWRRSSLLKGSPGQSDPIPPPLELTGYQLGPTGLQVTFDAGPATAWVLETSGDLVTWSAAARFVGPINYLVPTGAGTAQFLRAVVE